MPQPSGSVSVLHGDLLSADVPHYRHFVRKAQGGNIVLRAIEGRKDITLVELAALPHHEHQASAAISTVCIASWFVTGSRSKAAHAAEQDRPDVARRQQAWFDAQPADTVIVAAIGAGVPSLVESRSLVERFMAMIRTKTAAKLDGWIKQTKTSLIAPLARSAAKDAAAIRPAIIEPWSNGRTER